jgi:hypothetical protein
MIVMGTIKSVQIINASRIYKRIIKRNEIINFN